MWTLSTAAGAAAALLLYFAYWNHRSGERPLVLFRRQLGLIAGLVLFEMALLILLVG